MATTLGYAEPIDAEFADDPFPSKVGGKPRWLDPTCPLEADKVVCDECSKPMVLLMQLSAPEDDPPEAFHRMLYVFICHNGICHKAGAKRCMRVFRSQLPEENAVYVEGTNDDGDEDDIEWVMAEGVVRAPACVVCGLLGNKACSKCHKRRYCSRSHQIADWDAGHKAQCCGSDPIKPESAQHLRKLQRMIYPEHVIVSEEEPACEESDDEDDDGEDTEDISAESQAVVPITKERAEDSEVEVDPAFMKFQKRIQKNPDQVLRYARIPDSDETAKPLFVSDSDQPQTENIPACASCGATREFEFQIMPQMINYLSIDSVDPNSIDWGTLLVYTCSRNCSSSSAKYIEEVICRQQFSSHGIGQKYMRAYHGDETAFTKQFDSLDI
ncbi:hypothetical protein EV183_003660 [Coemansia sp. RSA 2336]|nr:hypothetical protein EV183_003660 [Coemansia sp. RSA 2336]